jgi:hypothetical protein
VASFRRGTSAYTCMGGSGDDGAWRASQYRSLDSKMGSSDTRQKSYHLNQLAGCLYSFCHEKGNAVSVIPAM